jgi:peroxiredoxin
VISVRYDLGDTVENFELPDQNGQSRTLYDALEDRKMILVFFRGFW